MKIKIKDIAVRAGGVATGAIVATVANRFLGALNPKIRAIGKIAIGAVIPELMPKQKIVGHIGDGMMAIGAAELFTEFVPSAVSGVDDIMSGSVGDAMTIDEDFDNVSGMDDVVSGDDEDINGAEDDL